MGILARIFGHSRFVVEQAGKLVQVIRLGLLPLFVACADGNMRIRAISVRWGNLNATARDINGLLGQGHLDRTHDVLLHINALGGGIKRDNINLDCVCARLNSGEAEVAAAVRSCLLRQAAALQ